MSTNQQQSSASRVSSPVLFHRTKGVIPRIAAVHDMCGIGDCSLTCALPILSAAGCDVEPVPTSLFSSHTLFPHFVSLDTTDFLPRYLDAWKQIGNKVDAIYSGFLGSAQQVSIIERLYADYPSALRIVDPVMGDNGSMYPTYTRDMCAAVARLVPNADVVMPNLTEASLLTGIPYTGSDPSDDQIHSLLSHLLDLGAHHVVVKGIDRGDGMLRNFVASRTDGEMSVVEQPHKKVPFMLHGTGDAFASAMSAAIMCGQSVAQSADFAGEFVRACMADTPVQPDYERRGVSIELELQRLTSLIPR